MFLDFIREPNLLYLSFTLLVFILARRQLNKFDLLMIYWALPLDILRQKCLKLSHKLLSFDKSVEFCC